MFMGCCFFFFNSANSVDCVPTAKVITLSGTLKEYARTVTVSSVLGSELSDCFLCDSDSLNFDAYVPAMDSEDVIDEGQIYFVLPNAKLGYPLSSSDMAALAIRAGSALSRAVGKHSKGKEIRVTMPVSKRNEEEIMRYLLAEDQKRVLGHGYRKRLETIEEADD